MSVLNFYFKKAKGAYKINSKGKAPLYLQYNHGGKSCYFSTGVLIYPSDFDFEKNVIRLKSSEALDSAELKKHEVVLNKQIQAKRSEIQSKIDDLVFEGGIPTIDSIREKLVGTKKKKLNTDFYYCFAEFQKNSIGISSSTMRNYNTLKSTIDRYLKFKKKRVLDIEKIDFGFYTSFSSYMKVELSLSPNSIGERIKRLKAFLKHCAKLGYSVYEHLNEFKVHNEPKGIIWCDLKEVNALINHDFSGNPRLEKVRDIFVVGCHTGFRVSDLLRLTKDDIHDGLFQITTRKTERIASPPVSDFTKSVLKKYNGKMPSISDVKYNQYLKEVGEEIGMDRLIEVPVYENGRKKFQKLPKWKLLSSHVAVKSFITNCAVKKVDIKVVARATGKTHQVILNHYQSVSNEFLKQEVSRIF